MFQKEKDKKIVQRIIKMTSFCLKVVIALCEKFRDYLVGCHPTLVLLLLLLFRWSFEFCFIGIVVNICLISPMYSAYLFSEHWVHIRCPWNFDFMKHVVNDYKKVLWISCEQIWTNFPLQCSSIIFLKFWSYFCFPFTLFSIPSWHCVIR